ncbi:MAG: ATP-binding protein, partial [Gammaproteobacteria bacterium]|nr:ATP-binding protein [Gammaproteobacteria bacterium]
MGSLLFTIAGQLTEQFVLSRLQHDGESLLSAVNFDAQGQLKISGDRLSDIYERPLSGHYYQVLTKDAAPVVSRSLWDTTLQANLLVPGEVSNWLTIGPDDQHLLIWSAAYLKQQQSITIVVAENLSPLQQTLTRYSAALTGLTFVF